METRKPEYQIVAQSSSISRLRKKDSFEAAKKQHDELSKTWSDDTKDKLGKRKLFVRYFIELLTIQNLAVFGLLFYLVHLDPTNLQKSELVLSTLIAGTLGETYFIVRIMVEWMFKDIDYEHNHPWGNGGV